MKRKALLIGNTSNLQGVQLDLERFSAFLRSDTGGAWYSSEITTLENVDRQRLLMEVEKLKLQNLDYLIVLFSGHGGHQRKTLLELNGSGEFVYETSLQNIAQRQLNIYDCCRVTVQVTTESYAMDARADSVRRADLDVRRRYEDRIMQAIPQQIRLYSCAVGEYSYDTPSGAVYLSNFLHAARTISPGAGFKLVGDAHAEARDAVKRKESRQNPEADLPKCLSMQQLIISIK
ncbi:caspase family protein [Burkholderia sp. Ac-20379]|uniref:caspase family protein n=1 Tax=Burkholderia sp. Ac-20379 TaxID=2703900 RepID=UPI00197CD2BB|nr:caspase family protein [Burkholderia sp. Ac-20379]MBN3724364.1 caspase family protein [Burkholderia sp. Ac-20379]